MTNDPDQIRAQVTELLGEPTDAASSDPAAELDSLVVRREQAPDGVVRARETGEKGGSA